MYSLCLCQCIFQSVEIHDIKQVISTNKDFVSKMWQVMAGSSTKSLVKLTLVLIDFFHRTKVANEVHCMNNCMDR